MKRLLHGLATVILSACSLVRSEQVAAPLNVPIEPERLPLASEPPVVSPTLVVMAQQPTAAPATPLLPTATLPPSPTPSEQRLLAELPNFGRAPELFNTVWLNSDRPLRLAGLLGNVVLLDFWTYY